MEALLQIPVRLFNLALLQREILWAVSISTATNKAGQRRTFHPKRNERKSSSANKRVHFEQLKVVAVVFSADRLDRVAAFAKERAAVGRVVAIPAVSWQDHTRSVTHTHNNCSMVRRKPTYFLSLRLVRSGARCCRLRVRAFAAQELRATLPSAAFLSSCVRHVRSAVFAKCDWCLGSQNI